MPNPLAVAHARKILEDFCFNYPGQYNLKQIINARGLTYREAPLAGSIGNIIFDGKGGSVTVSSNLNDTAQKNFTAAHELGHFENEREALTPPGIPFIKWEEKNREEDEKALFPSERGVRICKYEDIMSIKKNINYEMNANDFAAELLMHEPWFVEKVKGKKLTAELLKETAAYFQVSLTAAAIRYAEIGTHPAAIVMSKDGVVKWSSINKGFPYQFIKWGEKVDTLSYVHDIFKGQPYPVNGEDVPAEAWFKGSFYLKKDERVNEFNLPMLNYNSVLTVLWY